MLSHLKTSWPTSHNEVLRLPGHHARRSLPAGTPSCSHPAATASTTTWLPPGHHDSSSSTSPSTSHEQTMSRNIKQPRATQLSPQPATGGRGPLSRPPTGGGPDQPPPQLHAATAHAATCRDQVSTKGCATTRAFAGGCGDHEDDGRPLSGDRRQPSEPDDREAPPARGHAGAGRTKRVQAALSRLLTKEGARSTSRAPPTAPAQGAAQPPAASNPSGSSGKHEPSAELRVDGSRASNSASATATSPDPCPAVPRPRPQQSPRSPSPAASRHPQPPHGSIPAGSITIPSSPMWHSVRRQFRPCPGNPQLPHLDGIVLVEGSTDCFKVQRAVDVAVYAIGGSGVMTQRASDDIKLLATLRHELIILMDPDREGSVLREHLGTLLESRAKHAFIPAASATSSSANLRHEAGNLGVENADAGAIWHSLQGARPSYGPGRTEFSLEQLMELGLVNSFHTKEVLGAKLQRSLLCGALGIGLASGTSLVKVLNRYFSREQFDSALADIKEFPHP